MQALRVSAQVLTWVEARSEGRVHSRFVKACNLAWGDWLISLVRPELGMVPGGVAVTVTGEEESWGFLPGDAVFWDSRRQRLMGTRSEIDLSQAVTWTNQPPVPALADADSLRERIARATEVVRLEGRGELARVLATDPPAYPTELDPLHWSSFAWGPMAAVLEGLAAGDGEAIHRPLRSLVGLGEGLTPSGDDFVTGLLAALHYGRAGLNQAQTHAAQRLTDEAVRLAPGTTPVSANYLRLAAAGGFSERLESIALALLAPAGGDVAGAARSQIQIGHSSGTDSLVGLLLGTSTLLMNKFCGRRSQ